MKNVLIKATIACGDVISEYFKKKYEVASKDCLNDIVTEVDLLSEKKAIGIIQQAYPQHAILSEESSGSHSGDSEYTWIIDPIDGTVNFAHEVPICCVSIAVMHNSEIIMGAVYNPIMKELFFAEKGIGAYLNSEPIKVSATASLERALAVVGFPYTWSDVAERSFIAFKRALQQGICVKDIGSAALSLCWLACGRFDAFWHPKLYPWDVAAAYLIVKEAGGEITDFDGVVCDIYRSAAVASNSIIHEGIIKNIIK